ncbi:glycoside hydrolase family 2 protein [Halopiger xanaduensis]|uniref:Glycoside hydrolase family 2 sugar binding protein n=1 Tax=Halopiger xanaduensis (strain DSM 18323 / JCM 14033 / SH-6) TaxID=797210 RepID=F8D3T8_HALXS|nr:sugar-binding domain-containing protein [Halopiger xanaduensis]AEH38591.1 glycoside hydrolase family 2 sugar binding protein [Halopiger xanaduensis SH-6]
MRTETHSSANASGERRRIDLSGPWRFVTDPDERGRERNWAAPDEPWPDRARTVEVPHVWQEHDECREYTGTAWYRRTIDLEAPPDGDDRRALLRFGAVDYEAVVRVNGERAGSNRGGYLPFSVDVTDALVEGENTIAVEVTDPDDISEIPHGKQGEPWYQRVSGIWQKVTLEDVPACRVEQLRAAPNVEDDTVRIELETTAAAVATVEDPSAVDATITVEREGTAVASATTALEPDGTGDVTISIEDPDYWTPETPALYDVRVALERDGTVVDRDEDYFGMRSVEARDGRIYLNGEPYPIRGALEQGYYPRTLYRPSEDDWFEREVRIAKDLGFNLLRKHIKPAHPDFLEAADRLGLFVWAEPANPSVCTERSKEELADQLRGMLERDYNRPSVVVWSIYNEEWGIGNPQGLDVETSLWDDGAKQASLAELYEETKAADPTRLVCDNSGWAHVATDINDYHRYFVSPDRADAWAADLDGMVENPEANYAATETDPDDAPIVVSEFGTWGLGDIAAVEDAYDGEPPWFDYEFLPEGLKRPAGYRERFADSALAEAFDDLEALAEAWQRRQLRSNKDVIEQMRARDEIAGYVLTEFSDIEWEFNGLLDYRREPKGTLEAFARVNAPVAVQLDLESRAVWDDGRIAADAVVVNDTAEELEADLSWTIAGESGRRTVAVDPASTVRVADLVDVAASDVIADADAVTTETIALEFGDARTEEPVTVCPRSRPRLHDGQDARPADATVYVDDALRTALGDRDSDRDPTVVDRLDEDVDVALVTETTDDVLAYARDGGDVLAVADSDGSLAAGDGTETAFDYRNLPEDESWNLVASLLYTVDERLERLFGTVPGWELDGLYPYAVADVDSADDAAVGYVEGWLANPSAAITTRDYGDGTVQTCTFRVADAYGDHPTATVLVDDLLSRRLESAAR